MHGEMSRFTSYILLIRKKKDIKIDAKGSITLSANSKINCTSKSDVSVEGTNVNVKAKVGATVKGNAKVELSASGQTTVKGAMVMIN